MAFGNAFVDQSIPIAPLFIWEKSWRMQGEDIKEHDEIT